MKLKQDNISLKKWPNTISQKGLTKRNLSPLTSKILNLTKTDIYDLMPISLEEFRKLKAHTFKTISEDKLAQLYMQEITYRRNRLKLLESIWKKTNKKAKPHKSLVNSSNNLQHTIRSQTDSAQKSLNHKTKKQISIKQNGFISSKKQKSLSPLIFKKEDKKHSRHQYFDDYTHNLKQKFNADESTKSRRKIDKHRNTAKRSVSPNYDYYETNISKKNYKNLRRDQKIRHSQQDQRSNPDDTIYESLQNLLQKWTQVFDRHANQLCDARNKGITETQQKRLQKMQRIEQAGIKEQIDQHCQKLMKKNYKYKSLQFQ